MGLTNEQIEFLTTGNPDTQTGLPEPENTIQVIRSLNSDNNVFDIDYEQLTVVPIGGAYRAKFETISEMYNFVAYTIG